MYAPILRQRSKTLSDLTRARIFTRFMGGGPRTFPGGINKWQWKRLHEKRAKEKEKRLLEQEKQIYQARIRSQIRAKLSASQPDPDQDPSSTTTATHTAMTPKDHIKALADRFMKEGAEDLWNENDGPLKSNQRPGYVAPPNQRPGSINSPVDLRKLISENGENASSNYNYKKARDYSVLRGVNFCYGNDLLAQKEWKFSDCGLNNSYNYVKGLNFHYGNDSSTRKEGKFSVCDSGTEPGNLRNVKTRGCSVKKQRRYWRNGSSSSDDDDNGGLDSEDEGVRRGKRWREIGSRAALGTYDVKMMKRVPIKRVEEMEEESDFGKDVELIRYELEQRKLVGNEAEKIDIGDEEPILTQKRFDECGISPLTVKALTAAGYIQMTRVQEATLTVYLEGKDALVKAKTGTGKSIAYLLPAIEAVLKATSGNPNPRVHPIYTLILCPTRELASQIAAVANAMLKYHDGISVQTLIGGTRFKVDQKHLESDPCQIIVASPGRLLDHIENKGGLSVRLMGLKMLIVDEVDRLLDLGFRKDVEKIVDSLPRQRQSLMLSATIPKEVRRIAQLVLRREHAFVDTVGLGCVETPVKVKQSFLVVPHELHFHTVYNLLKEHINQTPDYKVIVFCTTGMVTGLMHLLLQDMKMNVREIHSRKPQLYRTRVSDEFRESKRLILVTSDVSARGMNYPDVTLVIQVGIPYDREQYIHRLGRTGREGKYGEAILLLAPWEEYFLDELEDLPLEKISLSHIDPETKLKIMDSMSKMDNSVKEAAYHAWLGYYNSIRRIGRDKTTLVELANRFCESIGLRKPPPLFRKTALKMGLKDVPGIRTRN